MDRLFGPTSLNLAALAVGGGLVAAASLLAIGPLARYAAWLAAFAVWMAWFVVVAREWISRADF
jgi:uncharacterized membrane protein YphA (DoxX/SURF4 family)